MEIIVVNRRRRKQTYRLLWESVERKKWEEGNGNRMTLEL